MLNPIAISTSGYICNLGPNDISIALDGYQCRATSSTVKFFSYWSLIQEARQLLDDDNELWYRYPDSMMMNALNRGLHELSRIRPDAYYDLFSGNNLQVPEISELDITPLGTVDWMDEFALDLRFYPPLSSFIMGMMLTSEDSIFDAAKARRERGVYGVYGAEAQLNTFRRQVLAL